MAKENILIVVHPGSLCGSMDFNLGFHQAGKLRRLIIDELNNHNGNLIILDEHLSEELNSYEMLNQALLNCLRRSACHGLSIRAFAQDPDHGDICASILKSHAVNLDANIVVTGAWFDINNRFGCVNHAYDILSANKFSNLSISKFAVQMDASLGTTKHFKKPKNN